MQIILDSFFALPAQGALTHVWNTKKLPLSCVLCFVAAIGNFLIPVRGKLRGLLMRGLEPRLWKSLGACLEI